MRARSADTQGHVVRDGLSLGYEVFGVGDPTILLMPTWTIIHSRFWKFQVPYLARHYRVITFDGPGNGRTARVTDPVRYALDAHVADALAVLDECEVDRAVVVGYSDGGKSTTRLAQLHGDRVLGAVMIAPNLGLTDPLPERARIADNFYKPYPENPEGWEKYNAAYWLDHYDDFVRFFMSEIFTETYTTKPWDDAFGWGLETTGEVLLAEMNRPKDPDLSVALEEIRCPMLLIHGNEDRVLPYEVSVAAARITGGSLLTMVGTGHGPQLKEPVLVNLALRDFIERLAA